MSSGSSLRFASSIRAATAATCGADAEVLYCWDLPTADLARVAPKLKWIHIIGAGVEHLCPMDWVPDGVQVVNNKGAHAAKAGEFALMAVLMLHNKLPAIVTHQRAGQWYSLYSTPIAGKTAVVVGVGSLGGAAAFETRRGRPRRAGLTRRRRRGPGFRRARRAALPSAWPRRRGCWPRPWRDRGCRTAGRRRDRR